jgi:hypothetical protein
VITLAILQEYKHGSPVNNNEMLNDMHLLNRVGNGGSVVPAQTAEDHGTKGGPDGEPATSPHQGQRGAVRGPSRQTTPFATPHLLRYLPDPKNKAINDFKT